MKLKSVSGLTCYSKNISKTIKFYEAVGFSFRKIEPTRATAYVNWFWIDFLAIDAETRSAYRNDAKLSNKKASALTYISVDDVDGFYESLRAKGLKPSGKPHDSPWGNREFFIRDPDGYKLVFFQRS